MSTSKTPQRGRMSIGSTWSSPATLFKSEMDKNESTPSVISSRHEDLSAWRKRRKVNQLQSDVPETTPKALPVISKQPLLFTARSSSFSSERELKVIAQLLTSANAKPERFQIDARPSPIAAIGHDETRIHAIANDDISTIQESFYNVETANNSLYPISGVSMDIDLENDSEVNRAVDIQVEPSPTAVNSSGLEFWEACSNLPSFLNVQSLEEIVPKEEVSFTELPNNEVSIIDQTEEGTDFSKNEVEDNNGDGFGEANNENEVQETCIIMNHTETSMEEASELEETTVSLEVVPSEDAAAEPKTITNANKENASTTPKSTKKDGKRNALHPLERNSEKKSSIKRNKIEVDTSEEEYDVGLLVLANDTLVNQLAELESRRLTECSRLRQERDELKIELRLQETRFQNQLHVLTKELESLTNTITKLQQRKGRKN